MTPPGATPPTTPGRTPFDPTQDYGDHAMDRVQTQVDPAKVAQLAVDLYCQVNGYNNKARAAYVDMGTRDIMNAFKGRETLLKRAKELGFIQGGKWNLQDPNVAKAFGMPVGGVQPMSGSAAGRTARSFNQLPTD